MPRKCRTGILQPRDAKFVNESGANVQEPSINVIDSSTSVPLLVAPLPPGFFLCLCCLFSPPARANLQIFHHLHHLLFHLRQFLRLKLRQVRHLLKLMGLKFQEMAPHVCC